MGKRRDLIRFLVLGLASCAWMPGSASAAQLANSPIWQLGIADGSAAEFSNYHSASPEAVTIGSTPVSSVSKGLSATANPSMAISYNLEKVPAFGALFTFKLLNADKAGPEMAVFSNRTMMGLIQLWGTGGTTSPYFWKKTYQLYIPKEFLVKGTNILRLEAPRPTWCAAAIDQYMWWEWDYLKLEALGAPAPEPIHGNVAYLGTQLRQGLSFAMDDNSLIMARPMFEWLGIAYCGNTIRADLFSGTEIQQPERLKYLQQLRDLNMSVIAIHSATGNITLDKNGDLSQNDQASLKTFFDTYDSLFQWWEVDNEPGTFNRAKAVEIALAKYVNVIRPPWVKTTAPGWSYGDKGVPAGWEKDAAQRLEVEKYCQATNYHSYGFSYAENSGASFLESLKSFGGVEDGWPKEMLVTETGGEDGDWHADKPFFASSQPHASGFDRTLRAHIAVVDRTMQFATVWLKFSLFSMPSHWNDPNDLAAYPGVDGEDSRLKTFRRLALAYATHGKPLAYTYLNQDSIANQKVYFRAVDTSTLPALPGSGGKSNKVLLSFVNFEGKPQTMQVRVTMPEKGVYNVVRYSSCDTYAGARSTSTLKALPALDLVETLGPRESVQYILAPPSKAAE